MNTEDRILINDAFNILEHYFTNREDEDVAHKDVYDAIKEQEQEVKNDSREIK